MTDELKNCPFCNKEMSVKNFFSCDGYPKACGCWELTHTAPEAIAVWNTRPLESALEKQVEGLARKLSYTRCELFNARGEADATIESLHRNRKSDMEQIKIAHEAMDDFLTRLRETMKDIEAQQAKCDKNVHLAEIFTLHLVKLIIADHFPELAPSSGRSNEVRPTEGADVEIKDQDAHLDSNISMEVKDE